MICEHVYYTYLGVQLQSILFQELCVPLDIDKSETTPCHHQGDGIEETANRTIQKGLKILWTTFSLIGIPFFQLQCYCITRVCMLPFLPTYYSLVHAVVRWLGCEFASKGRQYLWLMKLRMMILVSDFQYGHYNYYEIMNISRASWMDCSARWSVSQSPC